jgi:hypothetical protein
MMTLEVTEDLFMAMKEEQAKAYHNAYIRPAELVRYAGVHYTLIFDR